MSQIAGDPPPIRLDTAIIHAENVTIGSAPAEPGDVKRRYRVNAVLFAILMVLLTVWFKAHLETYVTQLTIVGAVTGIALIQMLASWFPTAVDKPEELRKRWLARPDAWLQLAIGLLLAILLLLGTKSVYVKLGKTDESKVLVDIRDGDRTIEKLILDADHTTAGRPFFMFQRPAWKLVVSKPRGYLTHDVSFGLSGSDSATFPFEPKEFHVLRILARIPDQQFLPKCDAPILAKGTIAIGKKPPYPFDFCQYSMVFAGATEPDIAKIVRRHPEFEAEYMDRGLDAQLTGELARATLGMVRQHAKTPKIPEELHENQTVTITITYGQFVRTSTFAVSDSEIQSVYVGELP